MLYIISVIGTMFLYCSFIVVWLLLIDLIYGGLCQGRSYLV
uniref:Uncharacterized protein n=1 Tax=Anguilla anguilla TaxID=7936 RepID=A0A0E9XUZ2_ANGAN